jgi:hypothetical protein
MIPLNDRQTLAHHVRQAQAADVSPRLGAPVAARLGGAGKSVGDPRLMRAGGRD